MMVVCNTTLCMWIVELFVVVVVVLLAIDDRLGSADETHRIVFPMLMSFARQMHGVCARE